MSYDVYTGLLKAFPLRKKGNMKPCFTFDHNSPYFEKLKNIYPIIDIAGDGTDFSKAVNVLKWVSRHNYHKGNFNVNIPYNSIELLNYSYNNGAEYGINCVALATILSECLLSIGLKSRHVFIMPCSPYDGDNHVVTHVFIKELKKWVMLDPTYGAYLTNEQGEPLSLLELRDHFANQKLVLFSKEAKYNDDEWTEESKKFGIEYFAKNLFYFQTFEKSTFGNTDTAEITANKNHFITICPDNYDAKQIRLSNIEYRVKLYGDFKQGQKWADNVKKEKYNYCSCDDFETMPYPSECV